MQIPDWLQWVCVVWGAVLAVGTLDHLVRVVRARPGWVRGQRAAEAFDWAGSAVIALGMAAESVPAVLAGSLAYAVMATRRRLHPRP
ncbi:hypothetical protein ACM614_22585 [Streptomyces sp. 12297]